jgi:hypothetical protein
LPQVINGGEGYRLVLEVVPDPLRHLVIISFRLSGEGMRVYALLAPHRGTSRSQLLISASDFIRIRLTRLALRLFALQLSGRIMPGEAHGSESQRSLLTIDFKIEVIA